MTGPTAQPDSAAPERWTVRRILEWTTEHLRKHGSETPRLDAEILLAHARGCQRIELYTRYEEELTGEQRAVMRDLVRKRADAVPVAYLVGFREFYSLDFRVTPDVLIPRPDTETLVMELLQRAKDVPEAKILDVGTGSGCIAIAAAVNHPTAKLTAIDRSEAALAVARENAERHGVTERIRFLHGDLYAPLDPDERFDFVVSNPPYVREDELGSLQPEVRLHEPKTALLGGADGLDVVRRLVAGAAAHLVDGGRLLFEIAPEQAPAVRQLLENEPAFTDVRIIADLSRLDRVACVRLAG